MMCWCGVLFSGDAELALEDAVLEFEVADLVLVSEIVDVSF